MKTRERILRAAMGVWLAAVPLICAQTEPPAATNSPATRSVPPLPPLPPPLRLPTNAQQKAQFNTNYLQRLRAIRAGNTAAAPVFPRPAPIPGPIVRPPVASVPYTNRFAPAPTQPLPLAADADVKEYTAKPGETNAHITFTLTNTSPNVVTINEVKTSCGCTVAKLPSQPWVLEAGTNGQIHVTVDLRGKRGQLTKLVYVYGTTGTKTLTVKLTIPEPSTGGMADRTRNMQIATADRQAVFKNDCAKCHAEPTVGKTGQALYAAACAICHDSDHRASMVPDLHNLGHSTDHIYWKVWVTQGKPGTLMPAFAKAGGGPLTDEQINSLADYLAEQIPSRPTAVRAVPSAKLPAIE
jgi:cytochrome c553